jgi:hypothetical protein
MKTCSYCGEEYPDEVKECPIDRQSLVEPTLPPQELGQHEMTESSFGKASLIVSTAIGCLMLLLFVVAGSLAISSGRPNRTYPGQMVVGFAFLGLLVADGVALGLGIAALCQVGKKRTFGILGLVFSLVTILGSVGLVIFGLIILSRLLK